MKDGLYLVNYQGICAGYVVRDGEVTICAPVLRKKFEFFSKIARYIPTDVSIPPPSMAPVTKKVTESED
jgi:hypothetical protein